MPSTPIDIESLPSPPEGRKGWPWTEGAAPLPGRMEDGREWPTISLVTPTFNQGDYIEETIRSVLLQNYPRLEYLVYDSESDDDTRAVIDKYRPWIDFVEIQKDRGQAHAINKGFARSTGSIFQWINSDDLLTPGALAAVARECPLNGAFAGCVEVFGADHPSTTVANRNLTLEGLSGDDSRFIQPGLWISRSAWQACFPLDESLHYAFDWKMLWLLGASRCPVRYSPATVAGFRRHPGSKTVAFRERWHAEGMKTWDYLLESTKFSSIWPALRRLRDRQDVHRRIEAAGREGRARLFITFGQVVSKNPHFIFDRFVIGSLRKSIFGARQGS